MKPEKAKTCPICNEENKCGMQESNDSCWCFSVVFSEKLKKHLAENYDGKPCICKKCFEKLNAENA